MANRICVINGHPDGDPGHFCHALSDAYSNGAAAAGLAVDRVDVAQIAPACLLRPTDFATEPTEPSMLAAREAIKTADHVVIIFPIWLGTMPALLKAFFEQMARGGFAISGQEGGGWPTQHLKGRSARIIVTMGMPAIAYRLWFLNAGVSNLKRLILGLSGMGPIRQTTIGGIGALDDAGRRKWLARVKDLGSAGR